MYSPELPFPEYKKTPSVVPLEKNKKEESRKPFSWPHVEGRGEPHTFYRIVELVAEYAKSLHPKAHHDVLFRNAVNKVRIHYNVLQRLDINKRVFENYMNNFKTK
ncbi:MAG: hypothetical protein ACI9AR_000567 [Flavobacteriaceae bacterium]|jgi:hypothetical protein